MVMTPLCDESNNARRVEMSNLRRNDELSDEDNDFSESPRRGNTALDRHHQLHHENGEHEESDEESNNAAAAAAHNDNSRIRSSSTSENFNDDDNTSSSRHGSDFPLMQRDEISRHNPTTTIYNPNNNPHQKSDDIPSNEKLLGTAFCTFMTFALTQLLFAFIAGSEAMMGDSAAMIVDSITYLFNWIAERKKSQFDANDMDVNKEAAAASDDEADPVRAARLRKRNRRKMVLQLEIIPPVISVSTLVLVTIVVTKKAVNVLQLDMHRSRDEQKRPNVGLMLVFSIFNLGLDGVNVFCFSKANHAMGYATEEPDEVQNAQEEDHHHQHHNHHNGNSSGTRSNGRRRDDSCSPALTAASSQAIVSPNSKRGGYKHVNLHSSSDEDDGCSGSSCNVEHLAYTDRPSKGKTSKENGDEDVGSNNTTTNGLSRSFASASTDDDDDDHEKEHANLNMCSAYTHVFADTLRSIAVIIAATLAESVPEVTPEEADATAAIVVSFLILLSLMPLIQGLLHSVSELRAILAEERSEAMFLVPPLRAPEHDASSVMELT